MPATQDQRMPKKSLTILIAFAMLPIAVAGGCQQKYYASGVGGNLVRVKQESDGTWLYVPYDQVEKYRQAEKAKLDEEPTSTRK